MKEVVMYGYGSFKDYKGQEHKVIVCAVSRKVNERNCVEVPPTIIYDDPYADPYSDNSSRAFYVRKILSFGVSICNPIDNYNEEHGKKIAYNRALSNNAQVLTSSQAGFFNTATVTAMLNNYVEYIQRDPGSIINGYDASKKKFLEEKKWKDEAATVTNDKDKENLRLLANATEENLEYARKVVKYLK